MQGEGHNSSLILIIPNLCNFSTDTVHREYFVSKILRAIIFHVK